MLKYQLSIYKPRAGFWAMPADQSLVCMSYSIVFTQHRELCKVLKCIR